MKSIGWLGILPVATYILLCIALYLMQRSMLYFPTPERSTPLAEPLFLNNGEQTLKIWQLKRGSKQALIYFGGNAEDVADSIGHLSGLFPEYDLYLANYRGYGGSEGSPKEELLYSDALALYDTISANYERMSAKGRSLGSGIALYLATKRQIDSLILVTPYDSIARVARHHYPFFPVELLIKDRYDAVSRAHEVNARVLLLLAEHDEIIPRKSSENLAAHLDPRISSAVIIAGTGHNDIDRSPQYNTAVRSFVDQ